MSETKAEGTGKVSKAEKVKAEQQALLEKARALGSEADRAIADYEAALSEQVALRTKIDRGEIKGETADLLKAAVAKVQAASTRSLAASSASYDAAIEAAKYITRKHEKLEKAYLCVKGLLLGKKVLKLVREADRPDYTEKLNALYEQRAKYTTGPNDHYAINSYIKVAEGWKDLVNAYGYYQHALNEWYLHILSLSALHTLRACRRADLMLPMLDTEAKIIPQPPKGYSTLVTLLEAEEKTMTKSETRDCILNAARKMLALEETARMISRVFLGEENGLPLDPTGEDRETLLTMLLQLKLITTAQPEYFAPISFTLKIEDLLPKAEIVTEAEGLMCKSDITDKDFLFSVFPYVRFLCGEGYNGGPLV